jgi:hypothetical protein
MLKDLNVDQARFLAILARTARIQRDSLLGHVPEKDPDLHDHIMKGLYDAKLAV